MNKLFMSWCSVVLVIGLVASNQATAHTEFFVDFDSVTVECTSPAGKSIECADFGEARAIGQLPVEQALRTKNFSKLDDLYAKGCIGEQRLTDGTWRIGLFATAIRTVIRRTSNWPAHLALFTEWRTSSHDSPASLLAESMYWSEYAWDARGHDYAGAVSKENWELFDDRMTKSMTLLEMLRRQPDACVIVFSNLLRQMIYSSAPDEELITVFNEAMRRHPGYAAIIVAMSTRFQPRWGGSVSAFDRFARTAANRWGVASYATLYTNADNDDDIAFKDEAAPVPDWALLKRGFEELAAQSPTSLLRVARYLSFACRAKDDELYRRLRTRLVDYEDEVAMPESIESCDLRHGWHVR